PDLLALGVVDEIIPEPMGGAHTDHRAAAQRVGDVLEGALNELSRLAPAELVARRYERFRHLGVYDEEGRRERRGGGGRSGAGGRGRARALRWGAGAGAALGPPRRGGRRGGRAVSRPVARPAPRSVPPGGDGGRGGASPRRPRAPRADRHRRRLRRRRRDRD